MIPRLKEQYYKTSIDSLSKKFHIKNKLMAPKILKVALNMGLGKDGKNMANFSSYKSIFYIILTMLEKI